MLSMVHDTASLEYIPADRKKIEEDIYGLLRWGIWHSLYLSLWLLFEQTA
jgi:hypothetical protein